MKYATFLLLVHCAASAKLPSNFPKCDYKSVDFDVCFAKAAEQVFHRFDRPYEEIGLPRGDPLALSAVSISSGGGPVTIEQNLTDIKLQGLSKMHVDNASMRLDGPEKYLELTFSAPEATLDGQYNIVGKILLFPIKGTGDFRFVYHNFTYVFRFALKKIDKGGVTYLRVASTTFTITKIENVTIYFGNLFDGNKELGDNMNKLLNERWKDIFLDTQGSWNDAISKILTMFGNRFFAKVPLAEIVDNA